MYTPKSHLGIGVEKPCALPPSGDPTFQITDFREHADFSKARAGKGRSLARTPDGNLKLEIADFKRALGDGSRSEIADFKRALGDGLRSEIADFKRALGDGLSRETASLKRQQLKRSEIGNLGCATYWPRCGGRGPHKGE